MTKRQDTFAQLVASGVAQTDAAIQAGYSHATAHVKASQLMRDPKVKAQIAKLKRSIAKSGALPETEESDDDRKLKDHYDSPLAMFMDVMNNPRLPMGVRYKAAQDAAKYTHAKPAPKTKREQNKDAAASLAGEGGPKKGSRYAVGATPSHLNRPN